MSLQFKLNLIITSLLFLMLGTSAYFIVENARDDVRAEVNSTSNLVLHLLDAEIIHYTSDYGWLNRSAKSGVSIFRLKELGNIRHLKIDFYDALGRLRETNQLTPAKNIVDKVPSWFIKAMGLSDMGVMVKRKRVILNGLFVGELVVTPDPSYEIAEVWKDTTGLLVLVTIIFLMINIFVYIAVRYTFKPVANILAGLEQIEHGQYTSRLPVFKQLELNDIGEKFNVMADTLQKSAQVNHRLTQQIINLQEDERKSLARDIHDEIGQYLTAIHVDASAIMNAKKMRTAKESAKEISEVTQQMMLMVQDLLQRLRPRIIDELGIGLAIGELVHHWRQKNRSVAINCAVGKDVGIIDETVAITAYRVMQESLTNIAKHANAKNVNIEVAQDKKNIYMKIEDDGVGFDNTKMSSGYGLVGMKERIQGLLGDMRIESLHGYGTKIHVTLPKTTSFSP
jgi:two-component system, NarL family, sensor histidine kinase UhpB